MPTSLSCIASVDQRRLTEETGCGDSVRQRSLERPPPRDVPWSHRVPGAKISNAGTTRRSATRRRSASHTYHIAYRHFNNASCHQRPGSAALPSHGPWPHVRCDRWSVYALFRIASSGGKDNSSGDPVPRSRIACHSTRRKEARGVTTTLISAPTRCDGMLDTSACSPVPHLFDRALM